MYCGTHWISTYSLHGGTLPFILCIGLERNFTFTFYYDVNQFAWWETIHFFYIDIYIFLHLSLLHFAPMLRYIKVGVNFLMILRRSSHAPRAIKCDGLKDSMRELKEAQKKVVTKSPSGSFFWCSQCTTGRQWGKG